SALFRLIKPRSEFPLAGRVSSESCSLRYRILYSNSFQRRLDLTIRPTAAGTSLIGTLALPMPLILFCALWSFLVLLAGGVELLQFLRGNLPLQHSAADLLYLVPL